MSYVPKVLDIAKDDPAYCRKFRVLFNGKEQKQCLRADTINGCIQRYKVNGLGFIMKNKQNNAATETLFGDVVIEPLEVKHE